MDENDEDSSRDERINFCWHCCDTKDQNMKKKYENEDEYELNQCHNMSLSSLYLLCLVAGASSLAIVFWLQRIDIRWIHIFVICLTTPAFIGFTVFLACRTSLSENTQPAKAQFYRRSYMIAMIPCCLAVLFLDIVRFILYIQSNKTIYELVFINLKIFYVAFQVLFFAKYLGRHLEESLISRLLLTHLIGTNLFLWFHEFSMRPAYNLEFLRHQYAKSQAGSNAKVMLKIIEASEPYVYPLVIQYMIIASVASYQIWLNMRNPITNTQDIYIDDDYGDIRSGRSQRTVRYVTGPITNNDLMQANVETSDTSWTFLSCGLIFGSVIFVGLVLSGLLLLSHRVDRESAITIYSSYELVLFVCMIFACCICLKHMPYERVSPITVADLDILILIPMLGYLLYAEFSFIAAFDRVFIHLHSSLLFFLSLARVIQSLLQTLTISKAFRHGFGSTSQNCCSPAFNSVMLLLFANAGLWVTESIFDLRIAFVAPVQCHFFGNTFWRLIKIVVFPFCVLFRFISCTSLLEILLWSDEY